jgi:uncharacterized membrane protein
MNAARGARAFNLVALFSLLGLIVLALAWELRLAPLRPGGSWLVLKALPLLLPLRGILAGRRYTHQWASMLALGYLAEGLVRATSDRGPSARLALLEVALACALFFGCALYAKVTGRGVMRDQ